MEARSMSVAWRDNHPSRYGQILNGDYGPFGVGDRIHFVQFSRAYQDYESIGLGKGYILSPGEETACGEKVPDDWKRNPTAHPIGGVVDCEACLDAYRKAVG